MWYSSKERVHPLQSGLPHRCCFYAFTGTAHPVCQTGWAFSSLFYFNERRYWSNARTSAAKLISRDKISYKLILSLLLTMDSSLSAGGFRGQATLSRVQVYYTAIRCRLQAESARIRPCRRGNVFDKSRKCRYSARKRRNAAAVWQPL